MFNVDCFSFSFQDDVKAFVSIIASCYCRLAQELYMADFPTNQFCLVNMKLEFRVFLFDVQQWKKWLRTVCGK